MGGVVAELGHMDFGAPPHGGASRVTCASFDACQVEKLISLSVERCIRRCIVTILDLIKLLQIVSEIKDAVKC